jgi:hypothetical protein
MEKPVQASEIAPNAQVSHPGKIIGFTTCVIGLLLVAAGAISGLRIARTLDFSCGAILLVIGLASAFGRRTVNKERTLARQLNK